MKKKPGAEAASLMNGFVVTSFHGHLFAEWLYQVVTLEPRSKTETSFVVARILVLGSPVLDCLIQMEKVFSMPIREMLEKAFENGLRVSDGVKVGAQDPTIPEHTWGIRHLYPESLDSLYQEYRCAEKEDVEFIPFSNDTLQDLSRDSFNGKIEALILEMIVLGRKTQKSIRYDTHPAP